MVVFPSINLTDLDQLRKEIEGYRQELLLPGHLDVSTNSYVSFPIDDAGYRELLKNWTKLLPSNKTPAISIRSRADAFGFLDALDLPLRKLQESLGLICHQRTEEKKARYPDLTYDMKKALDFIKKNGPVGNQEIANECGVTVETVRRWCNEKNKGHLYLYGVRNKGNKQGYYYDRDQDISRKKRS